MFNIKIIIFTSYNPFITCPSLLHTATRSISNCWKMHRSSSVNEILVLLLNCAKCWVLIFHAYIFKRLSVMQGKIWEKKMFIRRKCIFQYPVAKGACVTYICIVFLWLDHSVKCNFTLEQLSVAIGGKVMFPTFTGFVRKYWAIPCQVLKVTEVQTKLWGGQNLGLFWENSGLNWKTFIKTWVAKQSSLLQFISYLHSDTLSRSCGRVRATLHKIKFCDFIFLFLCLSQHNWVMVWV